MPSWIGVEQAVECALYISPLIAPFLTQHAYVYVASMFSLTITDAELMLDNLHVGIATLTQTILSQNLYLIRPLTPRPNPFLKSSNHCYEATCTNFYNNLNHLKRITRGTARDREGPQRHDAKQRKGRNA